MRQVIHTSKGVTVEYESELEAKIAGWRNEWNYLNGDEAAFHAHADRVSALLQLVYRLPATDLAIFQFLAQLHHLYVRAEQEAGLVAPREIGLRDSTILFRE